MTVKRVSLLMFYLFSTLLIGGAAADFLSTWLHFHNHTFWRMSLVFRGVLAVILITLLLMFIRRWPNYTKWFFISFVISVVSLFYGYATEVSSSLSHYFEAVLMLYKMVYPIILFVALRLMVCRGLMKESKLFVILDITLSIYLFFIFLGLVTGSDMFSTYWNGLRPGFKGIILTQNEATGVVLLAIFWFGLRFFSGERHVMFFIASMIAALVLGTKGALIGSVPLIAGLFWARYGMLKMLPTFGMVGGGLVGLALMAYQYNDAIHAAVTLFLNYMAAHSNTDSMQAIIALLTSGRSDRVLSFFPIFIDNFSLGFLVGGTPYSSYGLMEIDPIDAFLLGGIMFFILLSIAYWRMFLYSGEKGGLRYKLVLLAVWVAISATGGHLLMAATAAPMLVIALLYTSQISVNKKVQFALSPRRGLPIQYV